MSSSSRAVNLLRRQYRSALAHMREAKGQLASYACEVSEFHPPCELESLEPRLLLAADSLATSVAPWGYDAPPDVTIQLDSTPTGSSWFLTDHWGGAWVDAEKSPATSQDDLLCWAASAANVLDWTGWGFVGGMADSDDIFGYFQDHFINVGGGSDAAWQWFFTGVNPNEPWMHVDVPGGGFYTARNFNDYVHRFTEPKIGVVAAIAQYLQAGYGVTLSIQGSLAHVITCWGYNYNPADPSDIYGVWVTDSDDDKGVTAPPDQLHYYGVAFNGSTQKWSLQNYFDGNIINDVYALEPNDWPAFPYVGVSGTTVFTNPFGDATLAGQSLAQAGARVGYNCWFDSAGSATVSTSGTTDTLLGWHGPIGRPRLTDDDSGPDNNAQLTYSAIAEQVHGLTVRGYGQYFGSYGLTINGPAPAVTSLTPSAFGGVLYSADISGEWDFDMYRVTTTRAGTWTFSLACGAGLDGTMIVYDSAGNPVAGSYTSCVDNLGAGGLETWSTTAAAGATYYIRADGYGDSTGTYSVKVQGPGAPDLVAQNLAVNLAALPADGRTTVTFKVGNQGNADADWSMVAFYLSDDAVITTADQLLTTTSTTAIAQGSSFTGSIPLDLPDPGLLTDNQYYVGMIVDCNAQVAEGNETNNANLGLNIDRCAVLEERHVSSPVGSASPELATLGSTLTAALGDEWIGSRDIDTYSLTIPAGQTPVKVQFDVDHIGTDMDTFLRLYDASWNLLASSDDAAAPGEPSSYEPFLDHTFTAAGTVYLVLSGYANRSAAPATLAGRASSSTGEYSLTLTPQYADLAGGGFAMSPATGKPASTSLTLRNLGAVAADRCYINYYLSDDATIAAGDTSLGFSIQYDVLPGESRVVQWPLSSVPASDPFRTDNQYWIGAWLDLYGIVPESNEANNLNQGLGLDMASFRAEQHLNSPLNDKVVAESFALGATLEAALGDEWIGNQDIDTFRLEAPAGTWLSFDLDSLDATLDSVVRLYDGYWNLLAQSDNAPAPGEGEKTQDSYLEYYAPVAQRLYVVVSGYGNHDNDPRLMTGRAAAGTGRYTLTAGQVASAAPNPPDLRSTSDTGQSSSDNLTYLDNSPGRTLSFRVLGVPGATATLVIDGRVVGSGVLNDEDGIGWANITTDGQQRLIDGRHTVLVRQQEPGKTMSADSLPLTLTIETTAPTAGDWSSIATHGTLGEVWLSIPDSGVFIEPRSTGLRRLVVQFTEPIAPASFASSSILIAGQDVNGSHVDLSGIGIVTSLRNGGTEGVIDFSQALPNAAGYTVRLSGVTDAAGNPLAGDDDRTMGALIGDTTVDGAVDAADFIALKRAFGSSVSWANASIDSDGSGTVDYGDLLALLGSIGQNINMAFSPPELPAQAASLAPSTAGGATDIVAEPEVPLAESQPSVPLNEPPADILAMAASVLDSRIVASSRGLPPALALPGNSLPLSLVAGRVGLLPTFPSPRLRFGRACPVVADALQLVGPWWPGDSARHEMPDEPWMTRPTVDILGKPRKDRFGPIELDMLAVRR